MAESRIKMEDTKITLDGIEYVLKPRTFKVEGDIEDKALTVNEDGKITYKKGVGHYKKIRLWEYIKSIDGNQSLNFERDINNIPSDHINVLLEVTNGTDPGLMEDQYRAMLELRGKSYEKLKDTLSKLDKASKEIDKINS